MQELEANVVDGNGTETGHVIVTTLAGANGQPKQVLPLYILSFLHDFVEAVDCCD